MKTCHCHVSAVFLFVKDYGPAVLLWNSDKSLNWGGHEGMQASTGLEWVPQDTSSLPSEARTPACQIPPPHNCPPATWRQLLYPPFVFPQKNIPLHLYLLLWLFPSAFPTSGPGLVCNHPSPVQLWNWALLTDRSLSSFPFPSYPLLQFNPNERWIILWRSGKWQQGRHFAEVIKVPKRSGASLGGPDSIRRKLLTNVCTLPGRRYSKQTVLPWTGPGKGQPLGARASVLPPPGPGFCQLLGWAWITVSSRWEPGPITALGVPRNTGMETVRWYVCVVRSHDICGNLWQHHGLGFYFIVVKTTLTVFHRCVYLLASFPLPCVSAAGFGLTLSRIKSLILFHLSWAMF